MGREDILRALRKGEGQRVEFKAKPVPQMADDIVAFANTEGGLLLVGVDDNGNVRGIGPGEEKKVYDYIASIDPPPKVEVERVNLLGKDVLAVWVKPSLQLHTSRGVAYIRVGSRNRPLSTRDVLEKGAEGTMVDVEQLPLEGATMDDIHLEKAQAYAKELGLRGKNPLERLGFVKEGKPTVAGMLLFGKHPHLFIPGAYVDVVVEGEGGERKLFHGPLEEQLVKTYEHLLHLLPQPIARAGLKHRKLIPKAAIREALLNALLHRNYISTSPTIVKLSIPERRMRIINPGSFPPGVEPTRPIHKPRNPRLCDYMYRKGYMERLGGGLELMREDAKAVGWEVEIFPRPYFTEVIFRWPHLPLNEKEVEVYRALLRSPMTSSQLAELTGLPKRTLLRVLKGLEGKGLVKREGRGRSTVYRAL